MGKGFARQGLAAGAAATLAVGFALVTAAPASADQVWHQAVGRSSADASCPGDNANDVAQGWSKWAPSWAQWANEGHGGWVCTRSIRWAKDSPIEGVYSPDLSGCLFVGLSVAREGEPVYGRFDDSHVETMDVVYLNSGCTTEHGTVWGATLVATSAEGLANELCGLFGPSESSATALDPDQYASANPAIWECVRPED